MEITKQNGNICFNEESHLYWDATDESKKFISVTTLIHSFAQPFNKEFWSQMKALEALIPKDRWQMEKKSLLASKRFDKSILDLYDISENDFNREQQRILDEWEEKNRSACERGTKIHADLENSFYESGNNVNLNRFGIGGKFVCKKGYNDLDLKNGVYPEYLIHFSTQDGILNLAGQIDLLIKSGNDIIIGDWKTNQEIKQKGYFDQNKRTTSKMLYPLNNLDDCNFSAYNLQLSTYAYMLQRINPEFNIKDLMIVHFDHNNKSTIYHCEYLKDEVMRMLAFYKKKIIHELQKERRKPIVY